MQLVVLLSGFLQFQPELLSLAPKPFVLTHYLLNLRNLNIMGPLLLIVVLGTFIHKLDLLL